MLNVTTRSDHFIAFARKDLNTDRTTEPAQVNKSAFMYKRIFKLFKNACNFHMNHQISTSVKQLLDFASKPASTRGDRTNVLVASASPWARKEGLHGMF